MSGRYPFKRVADSDGLRYEFDQPITSSQYILILALLRGDYRLVGTPRNGNTAGSPITEVRVAGWAPYGQPLFNGILDRVDANVAKILRGESVERTVLLDPHQDHPSLLEYATKPRSGRSGARH
jgi:hypothetical protein